MFLPTTAATLDSTFPQHQFDEDTRQRVRRKSCRLLQQCFSCTDAVPLRLIQSVLNAAARLIARKRKYDEITSTIRDDLHWLPVWQRLEYKICVIVYKCLNRSAPSYLSSMCANVGTIEGRRHLRSAAHGDLIVPRTIIVHYKTYGPRCFAVFGPSTWNSLSLSSRALDLILPAFKKVLKTALFCRAYTMT